MQSKAEFQRSNPKNSAFFYCYKDYYDIYYMCIITHKNRQDGVVYEQKKNEIKTYENNLGFLNVTSKSGNSVLKEMEKRIGRLKEELITLEKKIEIIDEKI